MKMQGEMATDPYVEKSKSFSQPLSSYSMGTDFDFYYLLFEEDPLETSAFRPWLVDLRLS